MPRINTTGQERPYPPHDWHDIQNMIFENLFTPDPKEVEKLRFEVDKILEERRNVREANRPDHD